MMDDKNIITGMYLIAILVATAFVTSAFYPPPAEAYQLVENALMGIGGLATGVALGKLDA